MEKGDKNLVVIGVEHMATRNSVTVRVRVYFRRFDGLIYSTDHDVAVWNLEKLSVPPQPEDFTLGIKGIPE